MSGVVIVTENCYLVCEKIVYISTNVAGYQDIEDDGHKVLKGSRKKTKRKSKAEKIKELVEAVRYYEINVCFIPTGANQQHGFNTQSVTITCLGKKETIRLYSDMVKQLREQIPDNLWLDKLVSDFFTAQNDKG